jgi:hypothetical protein
MMTESNNKKKAGPHRWNPAFAATDKNAWLT